MLVPNLIGRSSQWLEDNGASHPKVCWPTRDTVGGVRGATAVDDIANGEVMIMIPEKLMISPKSCREAQDIGHVFKDNVAIFRRDDPTIAFFLVHERLKGAKSFWGPFIAMLSEPLTISNWSDAELAELQDNWLAKEARMRDVRLRRLYESIIGKLCEKYPELFSKEQYSFPLFRWGWNTIQVHAHSLC
jgi:hypothetical protein